MKVFYICIACIVFLMFVSNALMLDKIETIDYEIKKANLKTTHTLLEVEELKTVLERYQLYDHDINFSQQVEGVYYFDRYYSVWTGDRSEKAINDTEKHEACHHIVMQDYEHFCRDVN